MGTYESFDNTLHDVIFATSVQEGRDLNDAWRLEAENVSPEVRNELQAFGKSFIDFMVSKFGKKFHLDVHAAEEALRNLTVADPPETNFIDSVLYTNEPLEDKDYLVRSAYNKTIPESHPALAEFFTIILGVDPTVGPFPKGEPHILRRFQELVLAHELAHALIPIGKYPLRLKEAVADYYALQYFENVDENHGLVLWFGTDEEGFEKLRKEGLPVTSRWRYHFARNEEALQLVKGWGSNRSIVYSLKKAYLLQHYGTEKDMIVEEYVREFASIVRLVGHGFVAYLEDPGNSKIPEPKKAEYRSILHTAYGLPSLAIAAQELVATKKSQANGV